jgi:hypothetical protein
VSCCPVCLLRSRNVISVSTLETCIVFILSYEYKQKAGHCTSFMLWGRLKNYVMCLMACLVCILRDAKDLMQARAYLPTTSATFCTTTMQKGTQTMTEVQQVALSGSIAPHTILWLVWDEKDNGWWTTPGL